jgi:hypothetical protein
MTDTFNNIKSNFSVNNQRLLNIETPKCSNCKDKSKALHWRYSDANNYVIVCMRCNKIIKSCRKQDQTTKNNI